MTSTKNSSLLLGRRQKRLKFWQQQLGSLESLDSTHKELEHELETYRLLVARLVKTANSENTADLAETEERICDLERKLETLFEDRRLAPSSIGSINISITPPEAAKLLPQKCKFREA